MKTAILALTCGRIEKTRETFEHNLRGITTDVLLWDNSEDDADIAAIDAIAKDYPNIIDVRRMYKNLGIAHALNRLMQVAFEENDYDFVITMGNDILEPEGWVSIREHYATEIPRVGIVSIPLAGAARYAIQKHHELLWEHGHIIGNFGITRECFEAIGYMPEVYGIYGPIDLEYCDKAMAANLRTIYVSTMWATHLSGENPQEYQQAKDNSLKAAWPIYLDRKRRINNGQKL
jgi:GT2 family glycosyltransferase